jgi:hypothetical protein
MTDPRRFPLGNFFGATHPPPTSGAAGAPVCLRYKRGYYKNSLGQKKHGLFMIGSLITIAPYLA